MEEENRNENYSDQEYEKEAIEQIKRLALIIGSLLLAIPLGLFGVFGLVYVLLAIISNAVIPEIQAWFKLSVFAFICIKAITAALYLIENFYTPLGHIFLDKGTEMALRDRRKQ